MVQIVLNKSSTNVLKPLARLLAGMCFPAGLLASEGFPRNLG